MINFCILGNPRSGTTLLRLMLSAHSKVIVPPEAGFAVWLYENWSGSFSLPCYVDKLLATKKIESWQLDKEALLEYLYDQNILTLKEAILATYQYYGDVNGAELLGDKNNFYLHHISTLKELNPNLKYIHLIRDGRDVACSYLELMKKSYSSEYAPKLATKVSEIASEWSDNNQLISQALIEQQFILVRLEDLIEQPQMELEKICKFLGVDREKQMLDFYSKTENFEPSEYDEWKSKNKKPLINDNYKYRSILPVEDILEFNTVAKESILKFGYEL